MGKRKPDELVAELGASILNGDLPPGSRLTEVELARQLQVNRAPLREALFRLEERQLIERTPYSGMRVATLSKADLYDLYEVRELLEGRAARKAAELATQNDIDELQRIVDESHAYVSEIIGRSDYDARARPAAGDFHTEIARISGNAEIRRLLGREVWKFIRIAHFRWTRTPERLLQGVEEHRSVVRAIADRDPELAEILMIRHIRSARDGLIPSE